MTLVDDVDKVYDVYDATPKVMTTVLGNVQIFARFPFTTIPKRA